MKNSEGIFLRKEILMIAGPNGAGKTTTAIELLSGTSVLYEFINADEIAKALAPKHPESVALSASKLMIERLKQLMENAQDFAFETTGAGTNDVKHLQKAKTLGYQINLCFLWLSNPEQAIMRVLQRVRQGGHNIPEEVIIRRYNSGLKNLFEYYLPLADIGIIIDNSLEGEDKSLVANKLVNGEMEIIDPKIWQQIQERIHGR